VSARGPFRFAPPAPLLKVLLAGSLALGGWLALRLAQGSPSSDSRLWGTVYLVVGTNSDERQGDGLRQQAQEVLDRFNTDFLALHPDVEIQLMTFPEEDLVRQMRFRQQSGLGPDLLLVNSRTALELHRRGLVRSETFPAAKLRQLEPDMVNRLRVGNGQLAGLPVLQLPQLACYNRDRLPSGSPDDINGLLDLSSRGLRVGLSANPLHLFWTVGGLGAGEALLAAQGDQPLSPEQLQSLERWLAWLQNASLQQHVTFTEKQDSLIKQLADGDLDWITCRSSNLSMLRQSLGASLGVASLPGGRWGRPTPLNRERVMAFGLNSSHGQKRIAREMASFSINPLVQRNLTFTNMEVLPVNRFVPAPVASSAALAAMVRSTEDSEQTTPLIRGLIGNSKAEKALGSILNNVLFGELEPSKAAGMLPVNLRAALR
jgi:arabinogalactan oligomer / maltooligosaccharide transport system substrate-binding protein